MRERRSRWLRPALIWRVKPRRRIHDLESVALLGASLLRQVGPDDVEFLVLTRCASMDAIRAFVV
jgi:hypothetical protein